LSERFPGRDELRAQLDYTQVDGLACNCGCPSVTLIVDPVAPRAEVEQRVPTDAFGRDAHGTEVGVLLHVIDGYIHELEIYSTANTDQYGLPTKESLRLARWTCWRLIAARCASSTSSFDEPQFDWDGLGTYTAAVIGEKYLRRA